MSRLAPVLSACAGLVLGCIAPDERRPGLWLSGERTAFPSDWSFTDVHPEIAIEVAAPYLLAHSVTIWCVSVEGVLYVAARDPDEKNWPGWVAADPEVRLGIDGKLYEASLERLDDAGTVAALRGAYEAKYALPSRDAPDGPPMRSWCVRGRTERETGHL